MCWKAYGAGSGLWKTGRTNRLRGPVPTALPWIPATYERAARSSWGISQKQPPGKEP